MTDTVTAPVSDNHTVGENDPEDPQTEAELDLQMIAANNVEADNWFWIEVFFFVLSVWMSLGGGVQAGDWWLYTFAVHMFATNDLPLVNSISYGWSESDQCSINPDECTQIGVDSYGVGAGNCWCAG